ncbi:MAG: putative DNA binding domain-containing protein [Paludibacteraceae bacterium]|nr:putative DNA binding domain-containing protein [Paludibacteraceae bacterium]
MTIEELQHILKSGENVMTEFKCSQTELARKVYESICAMLNRRGGHIVLGVDDNGNIMGIEPTCIQQQLDTLAKDLHNPQLFSPICSVRFEKMEIEGKWVIYGYVPVSPDAHSYKGIYYDRNEDGDFQLRGTRQIANLFIRKSKQHTEERVLPFVTMDDLDENAFQLLRKYIYIKDSKHPWLAMTNEQILQSGRMIQTDPETGKTGIILAAVLLFGKEGTIIEALPAYKTDVLCRMRNTELYDDRIQPRCNILEAYERIMAFIEKHLSEVPYIENMIRISLRDKILREVVLNMLIHREYSESYPAKLTIWRDRIETENWNLPHQYGQLTPENMLPYPKNPIIANAISQTGLVEELGSGTRKIYHYTPLYASGHQAQLVDGDIFRIIIPNPDGGLLSDQVGEQPTEQVSTPANTPVSTPVQNGGLVSGLPSGKVGGKVSGKVGDNLLAVIQLVKDDTMSFAEIYDRSPIRSRRYLRENVLKIAIELGYVGLLYADAPQHPRQKYYLTDKGKAVLEQIRTAKQQVNL